MSTYDKILRMADTLIQQRGFLGFSYADLEKEIGIRKASIHHHFPRKTDLGLAYCQYKTEAFSRLNTTIHNVPLGVQRLRTYLDAFAGCAERGEMCGVYAMLSDSHQFSPELQEAVSRLVHEEIQILKDIISSGQNSGEFKIVLPSDELAVIVCSALKGALMLNRFSPHDIYSRTVNVLIKMLDART
ncbi:TetR/AcrR family transcriptional regulator [Escherichia coli]|uniref:TetR/AcrR family transcriptional regulator n=1 Tax=Escherichia coli TaxID=562 RepID=UPI000281D4ED|nr:TetR/AcrR family transcriptional regulator [Escherichia coli]EEV7801389.1 TetR/AcrR family transcriptional regulator [Escherichia coli]EEY4999777.1 TetR/AcrR family transcriptional regulator [Escherichia coli]EFA4517965.1 TetR/AcrR family transcriptional regulator [Escherichia coli]EFA6851200.1 TetR/AcrR family transcriptional regulator [Escherichia coli]EFA6871654.1 TetR/AcrR family transcriptional regulator [Escherichia coli]